MNKYFTIILLVSIVLSLKAHSQSISLSEFNNQMGRFYKACLYMRDGAKLKSPQKYENAMRLIHKDSVLISDFTPEAIDTKDEVSTDGHFLFTYANAKKGRGEIYVDPGNMREEPTKFSKEEGRCFVMHRALKSNGKTTYRYRCSEGKNCLAVICELRGEIELVIVSKNNQSIKSKSYEYDAVGFAKWTSEKEDEITFTIENITDHEVSFAVIAD